MGKNTRYGRSNFACRPGSPKDIALCQPFRSQDIGSRRCNDWVRTEVVERYGLPPATLRAMPTCKFEQPA